VLLLALARLAQDVTLDVVGDGDERANLEKLAQDVGVANRVRWHGSQPQTALVPLYRGASALVVPSTDEGLGLVAVEAMLCETPVVAFESGGLPDVVQHERTGLLVSERSPEALARAISDVIGRGDRGHALGAAGRLHALSTFAPESAARRYIDIYRDAIERSPA
jgi:glycosyltransferase involved in cell wall biosynthesis